MQSLCGAEIEQTFPLKRSEHVGVHDKSAVLLAGPAQVCHWLQHNNLWKELSPQPAKERVAHKPTAVTAGHCPVVLVVSTHSEVLQVISVIM